MRKEELLKAFIEGNEKGKGSNLRIEGKFLFNYSTIIAYRIEKDIIIVNSEKYSQTTTKNQNILKREAGEYGEMNEEELEALYEDLTEAR